MYDSTTKNNPIETWAEDLNRCLHTKGQQVHEKMFNITNFQRNANQNNNEVLPHSAQNDHH